MEPLLRFLISIAIFIASLSSTCVIAKDRLPNPITTIDEQVQYLLYLQQVIPTLFEQGAEYDVDFLAIINSQNGLVNWLRNNHEFVVLAAKRPPLMEIAISTSIKIKESGRRVDADELRRALGPRPVDRDWWAEAPNLVQEKLNGLITGMMSLYAGELKTKGFRIKNLNERLEFLSKHPVNAESFRQKFKASRYGLESLEWSEAIELAKKWNNNQLAFASYLMRVCGERHRSTNCEELFGDDETLWSEVLTEAELEASPELLAYAQTVRESLRAQFYSKTGEAKEDQRLALKLIEVPPQIGVWRGLVGGDCSTSTSFPFVYMPQERTFFVYSHQGELLGYLQGTVVRTEENSRRYFYIHSISGPSISRRHVLLALHGLRKAAKDLGYGEILLPQKSVIYRNINYVALHNLLYEILSDQTHKLDYPDAALRDQLAQLTSEIRFVPDYDSPDKNRVGHEVLLDRSFFDSVRIQTSPSSLGGFVDRKKPIGPREAILAALDLLASQENSTAHNHLEQVIMDIRAHLGNGGALNYGFRRQVAAAILQPYNIQLRSGRLLPIQDHLRNPHLQPLASYYETIRQAFQELDIELTDDLIESRPYLFYEGHLQSPDATTTTNQALLKKTVQFTIAMLKRWPRPYLALVAIGMNPSLFESSTSFRNFIVQLLNGTPEDYRKLVLIHSRGINFSNLDLKDLIPMVKAKAEDPQLTNDEQGQISEVLRILSSECESLLSAS